MAVYLDHNATSPLRPQARAAMLAALDAGGNPSSVHATGRAARALVERAREAIARRLCVRAEDLIFTSGGTEANNLALHAARQAGARRLLISAIEHDAVMDAARASGLAVEIWPVTEDGTADLGWLADRLAGWDQNADGPPFAALMAANNETGVIQPVAEAAGLIHEAGGYLHCDAVQAPGRIGFDFAGMGADYAALSAHKLGGPIGAGALAVACDAPISRQLHGGGQERGRRAGTENVAAIAGFAAALEAAEADPAQPARLAALRDRLEAGLLKAGARIWGANAERLPNTTALTAPGWGSEAQVIALDLSGIAVSAGAACSSGKVKRSRVLEAMGASAEEAGCALRISLGWTTSEDDIEVCLKAWRAGYDRAAPRHALAS